jgi:hypothetical protein
VASWPKAHAILEISGPQASRSRNEHARVTGTESQATLLHPVLRVYKDLESGSKVLVDVIHFDEDLFADYTLETKYSDKLYRSLRMFIEL